MSLVWSDVVHTVISNQAPHVWGSEVGPVGHLGFSQVGCAVRGHTSSEDVVVGLGYASRAQLVSGPDQKFEPATRLGYDPITIWKCICCAILLLYEWRQTFVVTHLQIYNQLSFWGEKVGILNMISLLRIELNIVLKFMTWAGDAFRKLGKKITRSLFFESCIFLLVKLWSLVLLGNSYNWLKNLYLIITFPKCCFWEVFPKQSFNTRRSNRMRSSYVRHPTTWDRMCTIEVSLFRVSWNWKENNIPLDTE